MKNEEINNEMVEPAGATLQTETPPVIPEAEATTEEIPSNGLIEKLNEFYPGEDINNENVNEFALKAIERLSGIQNQLIESGEMYPEFASMLRDVLKGMSPDEAIARNFDESILNPPDGDPNWEKISAGREELKKSMSSKKERLSTIEKNKQVSVENAEKFITQTGLGEEEAMKFLDWYDALHQDQFDGLISIQRLEALYKGYLYDTKMSEKDNELKESVDIAKAAGRNEQIQKKTINAESGDGIPKLSSSGGYKPPKKESYASNFVKGL